MYIKLTRGNLFDVENPERKFKLNSVLKVNDLKRAKALIEKGFGEEVEEAKKFEELDPQEEKETKKVKPSR